MASLSPDESLLKTIDHQFPCRELQIRQLSYLLWPTIPSPAALVVHGVEATGKSSIVKAILQTIKISYVMIKCQECITARHLFERTISAVEDELATLSPSSSSSGGRCETLSAFVVHLQRLLQPSFSSSQQLRRGRGKKFILVFDGIDRQREAPPTLLPALTRLRELTTLDITTIFILTTPRPGYLHTPGVPHVHFPAYTRSEALTILSADPLPIFPASSSSSSSSEEAEAAEQAEDNHWLWTRFTSIVYDSLGRSTARDIPRFRTACHKLWPSFTAPILEGTYGTRDFSKLMIAKRSLFQQSEDVLLDRIITTTTNNPSKAHHHHNQTPSAAAEKKEEDETLLLPPESKFILCAAYLASFNPARQDALFFMKTTERRRRRKKGGGTSARGSARAGMTKHRKIPRRLLNPHPFVLERLWAIFHAIIPDPVVGRGQAEIQTQLATLTSLRLIVASSTSAPDVLDAQTRFRVNVGWEFIRRLARSVEFEMEDYLCE